MTKIYLTGKQRYQLTDFVKEHYVALQKSDVDFAAYAAETLGFTITEAHISGIRKEWEIPNNMRAASKASLEQRISELTDECGILASRVLKLEEELTTLTRRFEGHARHTTGRFVA